MDATGTTPKKWHALFLKKLCTSPNVAAACRAARVDRSTAYRDRDAYPEFAAAWEEARQMGLDALEDKAIGRAEKESDTLMIFLLKAHRPKIYNVPNMHRVGGDPDGVPIETKSSVVLYIPANGREEPDDGDDATTEVDAAS